MTSTPFYWLNHIAACRLLFQSASAVADALLHLSQSAGVSPSTPPSVWIGQQVVWVNVNLPASTKERENGRPGRLAWLGDKWKCMWRPRAKEINLYVPAAMSWRRTRIWSGTDPKRRVAGHGSRLPPLGRLSRLHMGCELDVGGLSSRAGVKLQYETELKCLCGGRASPSVGVGRKNLIGAEPILWFYLSHSASSLPRGLAHGQKQFIMHHIVDTQCDEGSRTNTPHIHFVRQSLSVGFFFFSQHKYAFAACSLESRTVTKVSLF